MTKNIFKACYGVRVKNWPTKSQWRHFFKVLTKKEKILFWIFLILSISSFTFLFLNFYYKNTEAKPSQGGTHIEGLIGQPRFINPIYANSDADRDLVELIFSGLMKYNGNMEIIPDLAESYEISEDGKVYKFFLKENLFWSDHIPLTVDDIIFTIKRIQDPEYKSPLQANWVGVEVEAISDLGVKFTLKKSYSAFLENCTVKILPKHIWQDVSSERFAFDNHNLEPIGSGPYEIKEMNQERDERIKSLTLRQNPYYFGQKPYISEIKFLFFNNEKDLIKAAQQGKIKGLSLSLPKETGIKWQSFSLSLPRYFAVFFNPEKSEILSEKEIRIALNLATDKKQLIKNVLDLSDGLEKAIVDSPILPKLYGFNLPSETYAFDIEKAKNMLEQAGFKDRDQDGIREKDISDSSFQFEIDLQLKSQGKEVTKLQKCLAKFSDVYPEGEVTGYFGDKTKQAVIKFQEKYASEILEPWGFIQGTGAVSRTTRKKLNEICFEPSEETLPLKFSLITVDQPQLVKVAEELKKQWKAVGVELEIQKFSTSQLEQDFIKPRNYEALLFGEVLGAIPDILPFWHSSQTRDPGLNLAIYENEEADELLEEIRQFSNPEIRAEKLALFQDILIQDAPAVFLYCPDYIYLLSKKIKGVNVNKIVDPSKRFSEIENWYIKTKRVWK